MMKHNLEIGRLGEDIAKECLEDKGYSILEQNCRNKYGEIDLIARLDARQARDEHVLIFVEVKTRIGEQFGPPEAALSRDKTRRLIRNAQAYIARKNYNLDYRIDAVCIVLDENRQPTRVDHYENISI